VVEGDGLKEVAAAFLKALSAVKKTDPRFGTEALSVPVDSVKLYLKRRGPKPPTASGEESVEPEAREFLIAPPISGSAMRQAVAALSRWQARQVIRRARARLQATFPSLTAPSPASAVAPGKKQGGVRIQSKPSVAPVSMVVLQVEEDVCPAVETATDPAGVRSLLEALCRLDGRAFNWLGRGQTIFVRLVSSDGEEVFPLRVAIRDPVFLAEPYPGVSRAMADPPLPRPLWDRVYSRIYGDKAP
jgi:hypothetical protein